MPRLSSSSGTVVGLDIEPGHVAAVQAQVSDGELGVRRAATARLEPGVVRDGEVGDVEALASSLRGLWQGAKLPKRVRLGIANQRIVVRTVELPPMADRKELAAAVRFHAQDHIPMPLEQAVLEHQSLGIVDTPEGPRTRVVLVAARREMVDRYLAVLRAAGLRPVGVDLSAFAMIRALEGPGAGSEVKVFLSVSGVTTLALAEGSRCLFTRTMPQGAELLAQELAERRGLTLEHAHGWLTHIGLEGDVDGDPEIVHAGREVLREGVRRLSDEIRNTLDFYRNLNEDLEVRPAFLTGRAVEIPGFAEALGSETGLEFAPAVVHAPGSGPPASRLAIATGLAVEDRS